MLNIITHILHAFVWKSQSFLVRGEYTFGVRFNISSYCLLQREKIHRRTLRLLRIDVIIIKMPVHTMFKCIMIQFNSF